MSLTRTRPRANDDVELVHERVPRHHAETESSAVPFTRSGPGHPNARDVLLLQRAVGNAATAVLITPGRRLAIQRCGSTPRSECGCHSTQQNDSEADLDVQRAPGTPAPGLEATQPCGVGDRLLAFTTWALATTKLQANISPLYLSRVTGLMTTNLKNNLNRHFGVAVTDTTEQKRVVGILLAGYRQILRAMVGGIESVSCGGTGCQPGDYAYVYPGGGVNRLFFCDAQRNVATLFSDPFDLASTWIHELSHLLVGTGDSEYYNHSGSTTLTTAQALTNADCWGNFMVEY